MRGFLLTALAVLVAIAIGVAIEPLPRTSALPAPLARAITATMAVRSVEIRDSLPGASTPAVYEAPDRWEGPVSPPTSTARGQSISTRPVIIGDWEYDTLVGSRRLPGVFGYLRTRQHLRWTLDLPPAQSVSFGPLVAARLGQDFRRLHDTWTYRSHLGGAGVVVVGGSVTLGGGLVDRATIDEMEGGHRLVLRSTYSAFDRAPAVPTPAQARTAG